MEYYPTDHESGRVGGEAYLTEVCVFAWFRIIAVFAAWRRWIAWLVAGIVTEGKKERPEEAPFLPIRKMPDANQLETVDRLAALIIKRKNKC